MVTSGIEVPVSGLPRHSAPKILRSCSCLARSALGFLKPAYRESKAGRRRSTKAEYEGGFRQACRSAVRREESRANPVESGSPRVHTLGMAGKGARPGNEYAARESLDCRSCPLVVFLIPLIGKTIPSDSLPLFSAVCPH
jgi:hypothetical protein